MPLTSFLHSLFPSIYPFSLAVMYFLVCSQSLHRIFSPICSPLVFSISTLAPKSSCAPHQASPHNRMIYNGAAKEINVHFNYELNVSGLFQFSQDSGKFTSLITDRTICVSHFCPTQKWHAMKWPAYFFF